MCKGASVGRLVVSFILPGNCPFWTGVLPAGFLASPWFPLSLKGRSQKKKTKRQGKGLVMGFGSFLVVSGYELWSACFTGEGAGDWMGGVGSWWWLLDELPGKFYDAHAGRCIDVRHPFVIWEVWGWCLLDCFTGFGPASGFGFGWTVWFPCFCWLLASGRSASKVEASRCVDRCVCIGTVHGLYESSIKFRDYTAVQEPGFLSML